MKKLKILSIILLSLIIINPINVHAANTLGELKSDLAKLKKEKSDNEADKRYTQGQITQRQNDIAAAESAISKAENDINTAEEEINDSNVKIEELTKETQKLLVFTQEMKSNNSYIEYLFGSSSMTDLIMRLKAIEQVADYNQNKLKELEQLIKNNEQLKIDLKKKQEDLNNNITAYQEKIKSLYGNLESYDKFELDIDSKIKVLQASVNSYVKLSIEKYGVEKDSARLVDLDAVNNSGWLKPLKKGVTTSTIGTRWGSYHNALDIGGNSEGTPVYAAAAGRVSGFISHYRCGGNMLYVNVVVGGVQYTTYYYHLLTVNVKVGDKVDQNTVLGTVGGYSTAKSHGGYDSCTTGAHLHFGVAKGYFNGTIARNTVITPPGFPNAKGYRFSSRSDFYR